MIAEFRAERRALEEVWVGAKSTDNELRDHCRIVDRFIVNCFRQSQVRDCDRDVALVALGGYGREELFPCSDIDLMVLYRPEIKARIGQITDAVLYPLWDTGMEIGHGVRTVEESIVQAEEDYFFLVALLDARLIHGSPELYGELLEAYRKRFVEGQREDFVEKMKGHRQSRRERFGSHSYLLEPHIKEGRGGMRDIQAMMWTARMVFGLNGLQDIEDAGLLLQDEKTDFLDARNMLVRLRSYLHYFSKRKNDQLYFEQQGDVAEAFGYKTKDGILGVESFMRDVYRALQKISVISDLFFDHVEEVLGLAGKGGLVADKVVEKGIEVKTGRVHLTATRPQLLAKPQILVRTFLAMARTGLPLHHRTRKLISGSLELVNDKVRTSPRLARTFFAILLEAKDISAVLENMLETGVLTAWIPEFSRITTLAQHDLYHIYTVDRHSLQAVAELHNLVAAWAGIARNIKNMKVLYLAALLHDIGKGSGRDHSIEGAGLAGEIGRRFCFSEEECATLEFLVRYHLFIPENALRRDLNDAVFIKRCAETIGGLDRLAMLYLLSVADSKATGPSAWSDWKATLMEELYLKVYPHLDIGRHGVHDVTAHEEQGVEWLREQVRLLLKGVKDLRVDIGDLGADYILTFSPEMVARHVLTQRDHYQLLRQRSLILASEAEDSWQLLIMTVDRPGLLAKICGVMALNNLTVVKAQIFTWADGTVVDVIDVRSTDGLSFAEKGWRTLNEQLDLAIEHRMGLSHRLYRKLSSGYGRRGQMVGEVASKVVIDNKSSENYSVIEVYAADLPGQLYHITQAMADFGLNIHKAYIATEVEQLIDVFYVLDSKGRKLVEEDFRQEVTQGILHSISRIGSK
ncbi:MAG: protein-PII uridylyltransferase [Desulfobulbaceae bacterium BRH_c16a]|nr:MAG: protein-PII uridylyltransferase [Desulfobulbaceae bacterium BRH_c16a]